MRFKVDSKWKIKLAMRLSKPDIYSDETELTLILLDEALTAADDSQATAQPIVQIQ